MRYFKTPSGKVLCAWVEEGMSDLDDVVCEVTTGLKPPIPKNGPSCRHEEYVGNQLGLRATGPAIPIPCVPHGQRFPDPAGTSVLPYGKSLKGGGIACFEAPTGLSCRNISGHGFFLSPQHWHTF